MMSPMLKCSRPQVKKALPKEAVCDEVQRQHAALAEARRKAWAEMQELLRDTDKEREGRIEETLAWTPFQYTH